MPKPPASEATCAALSLIQLVPLLPMLPFWYAIPLQISSGLRERLIVVDAEDARL